MNEEFIMLVLKHLNVSKNSDEVLKVVQMVGLGDLSFSRDSRKGSAQGPFGII